MTFTTRKVVVLSTQHLTVDTCAFLTTCSAGDWPVSGGVMPYGFCVWAPEESGHEEAGFEDLFGCLRWARSEGFEYVLFDGDEDPREDLESFDHDAEREYGFDVVLVGTIRVTASSEAKARKMLAEKLDTADCNAGAWDNGEPITFEASLAGEKLPMDPCRLYAIDGEEVR